MACMDWRDNCACWTELPEDDGSALMAELACTLTASGSAPVARSSATATPSRWSMRAFKRWAGSSWGLPAVEAFMAAAERASWLLVVNLTSMGRAPFGNLHRSKLSLLCSTLQQRSPRSMFAHSEPGVQSRSDRLANRVHTTLTFLSPES